MTKLTETIFVVRIGKAGITDGAIDEIKRHLRQKKVVKVKFLSAFMKDNNKKLVANEIANRCEAIVLKQVGFTVVLKKY